ncbi:hypothetical protein SISNIDRAFT_420925, partial [Sistotremastrum niveocremeum HHB9708]
MTTPAMISHLKDTAPRFKGNPQRLKRFLIDFETLADEAKLTDTQKCTYLPRYATHRIQQLWEGLESFKKQDWKAIKDELYTLYPVTYDSYSYESEDLEALVNKSKITPIGSVEDFAAYHRIFSQMSTFLIAQKRLGEKECNKFYYQGLPPTFAAEVLERLKRKFTDKDPKHIWTMEEIHDAAIFVL